jgi:hypothetical protein
MLIGTGLEQILKVGHLPHTDHDHALVRLPSQNLSVQRGGIRDLMSAVSDDSGD